MEIVLLREATITFFMFTVGDLERSFQFIRCIMIIFAVLLDRYGRTDTVIEASKSLPMAARQRSRNKVFRGLFVFCQCIRFIYMCVCMHIMSVDRSRWGQVLEPGLRSARWLDLTSRRKCYISRGIRTKTLLPQPHSTTYIFIMLEGASGGCL